MIYIMNINPEKTRKKGPGRPRKNPISKPKPRNGVSDVSKQDINCIELMYDTPIFFKKIIQFFKQMAVGRVNISFNDTHVLIWCIDHFETSNVRVFIDCTKINHYYCEAPLEISLLGKNLEIIMNTIDKNCTNITFISRKETRNQSIEVIFENNNSMDTVHKIDLLGGCTDIQDSNRFLYEDYMIKINFSSKSFKKLISDISNSSDRITLKQDGRDDKFVIEYITLDKKIKSYSFFKNQESIVDSRLEDNDTFRVSIKIEYIKPISSSLLAENIEIYAHEDKQLLFASSIDNETFEIKVLTNIINDSNMSF
jgi:hypothetical protein